MKFPSHNALSRGTACAALLAVLTLTACGGGGGGGGGAPVGPGSSDATQDSLDKLGVPTDQTTREQESGMTVAEDYSPFGASWDLSITSELMLLGIERQSNPGFPLSVLDLTDSNGNAVTEELFATDDAGAPWAEETRSPRSTFESMRVAVAADFDGDGLQEACIVYQQQDETRIYVIDDANSGYATSDMQISFEQDIEHVTAAAGDFDGDGDDEIVIGLTRGRTGELFFVEWTSDNRFDEFGTRKSFAPFLTSGRTALQLAVGNIDYDRSEEIALVFNEVVVGNSASGTTRYAILDDRASQFALLDEDNVAGQFTGGVTGVAQGASIAIGDVDGDNLGEIIIGGLEDFTRRCTGAPYLMLAIDDAEHGLAVVSAYRYTQRFNGCNSPSDPQIRTIHLHTLDLDDDGVMEIVANRTVFEDFATAAPWTAVANYELPADVLYNREFGHFDHSTSSFVVGDFTGDDRDDIATYRQDEGRVRVFGVGQISGVMEEIRSFDATRENSQGPINPIILPLNVDVDGPVLKYSDAEYKLVFSEPIVLAALAAAPFRNGIEQNVDSCFTAFGNTTSSGSARERSVSFTASATVGVNVDGGVLTQSEFSMKAKASVAAKRKQGTAYNLSKSIIFNSAPAEDTVVFTSVPVDQYIYTVVSHPDPAMVGRKITVSMPREPVTRQAERSFFNNAVPEGSVQVGANVFSHTIGDLESYPTTANKNAVLNRNGGLDVGPIGVAQGGGSTTLVMDVSTEISRGGSLEVGFEIEVEATAGTVLAGVSVGSSRESSWQITSGEATTYTGQVGGIPAGSFAANQYSWGMFTYVHDDAASGQQFEVVNYWIEQ